MKTKSTIKHLFLGLAVVCSITACKKDKNIEPVIPPVDVKNITITDLKALSTSASVKVPDGRKVKGIVVSDVSGKNIDSKTLVIQEATDKPGIVVIFDAAQTFAVNDEVEITASNQTLAQVDGEVVLQNVPAANAKKTGTGTVTAKEATIAQILTNKAEWNGTLVKIAATELTSANSKFSGTLNVKDASGALTSQVMGTASFADDNLPASVSAVTGIVRINGNNVRLDIRKSNDIVIGAISKTLIENFENLTALIVGTTSPADILNYGFTTKAGLQWQDQASNGTFPAKNVAADAGFTTAGRSYIYQMDNNANSPVALGMKGPAAKGLKTVTVTFAMSKAAEIDFPGFGLNPVDVFNPATDNIQLAIVPKIGDATGTGNVANGWEKNDLLDLGGVSPIYKEAGKWYTFTYTLPTREQLEKQNAAERDIKDFLERPCFSILNRTKISPAVNGINLMIIDKVVLGYGN